MASDFPMYLTGAADLWYSNFTETQRKNFDTVEAAFKVRYCQESQNSHELNHKFNTKVWDSNNQSFPEYLDVMMSLARTLGKSEMDLIHTVVENVPVDMQRFIRERQPTKISQLAEYGKLYMSLPKGDSASKSVTSEDTLCALMKELISNQRTHMDTLSAQAQAQAESLQQTVRQVMEATAAGQVNAITQPFPHNNDNYCQDIPQQIASCSYQPYQLDHPYQHRQPHQQFQPPYPHHQQAPTQYRRPRRYRQPAIQEQHPGRQHGQGKAMTFTSKVCKKCNGNHNEETCYFNNKRCNRCNRMGHAARACRTNLQKSQTLA